MSKKNINILCVHGVGHGEADPDLIPSWTSAVEQAVKRWNPDVQVTMDFLHYDAYFQSADHNVATYAEAVGRLLSSGVINGLGDFFERSRDLFNIPQQLRWTAGMVAQWAAEEDLRKKTRAVLLDQLKIQSYDLVCAHSLGSLICYDTFRQNAEAISGKVFISFGSQIGNPFVRDIFAGRIEPLKAKAWYHLFNPNDHVLTARIRLLADNFSQIITPFDIPNDILNHDAAYYLSAPNASDSVWRNVSGAAVPAALQRSLAVFKAAKAKPTRRALLIGINEYPDPANRLEGCVNDVFLMSSLLQESTFQPEEIRVVLNERATAAGILERLHWLLDGTCPGDERLLFYSGHGAQIPGYGNHEEIDHFDECLVPYDFDWTLERAVTDKQFSELYSQLPYDSQFLAIFDCCHSGGMSRDGSRRVRGISPPDDIRHRALRWNASLEMWEERTFTSPNRDLAKKDKDAAYLGDNRATYRFGRSVNLRSLAAKEYDRRREAYGHQGPYLPIIMEACQESQLSYEYRHGVTSYGAYTYSLATVLRRLRGKEKKNPTFAELTKLVDAQLKQLKYEQTPCLLGPSATIAQPIPWSSPDDGKAKLRVKKSKRVSKK
jgi:hypothetical protein